MAVAVGIAVAVTVSSDRWLEVNILSTFQVPSSYGLGVRVF